MTAGTRTGSHRFGLAAGLGLVALLSCGPRPPLSPEAWLSRSLESLEQRSWQTSFEMRFAFPAEPPQPALRGVRHGTLRAADPTRFRMEAQTALTVLAKGAEPLTATVRDRQVGDGVQRWVELHDPQRENPVVRALELDGAPAGESGSPSDPILGPAHLDPLILFRLYARHTDFVDQPSADPEKLVLLGEPAASLPAEAARLGVRFRPARVRITLDRATALPMQFEILEDAKGAELQIRFLNWSFGPQDPAAFVWPAPAGTGG